VPELVVAGITAAPGTRVTGRLEIEGIEPAHHPGFTVVAGAASGPVVTVTAGIHSGEYNGVEAAIRLARDLRPDEVRGAVIVVPVANPPAFFGLSHNGSPLDGVNLNRVFPGDAHGSATLRLAAAIAREFYSPADAVVDLHGADPMEDLVPFVMVAQGAPPLAEVMARAYGIEILARTASPGSTIQHLASRGIPAILAEAGAFGHLHEAAIILHLDGCRRVLRTLGVLPGDAPPPVTSPWHRIIWVASPATGCFYAAVRAGDRVERGALLGRVGDLDGAVLAEAHAPAAGRIVFVKQAMATRMGNSLFGLAVAL
jgi:predicted deacylase